MEKAVFLDRDGVIIRQKRHLFKKEDIEVFPYTSRAIRKLNELAYKTIIVTNQSVVARGLCTIEAALELNEEIRLKIEKEGGRIDAVYMCPHHPTEAKIEYYRKECECRKPSTGMILSAQLMFDINLAESYVVGDKTSDIELGRRVGCKTILVKTGYSGKDQIYKVKPDFIESNLFDAVKRIESKK